MGYLHTAGSLKFCFLVAVSLPCLNNSVIIFIDMSRRFGLISMLQAK